VRIGPGRFVGEALIALVVAIGGAIAIIVLVTGSGQSAHSCHGALIPAYAGPDANGRLAAGPGRGRMVIVNPASGPGTAAQPAFARAIAAERRAGSTILGYVHTGYATRDPAQVRADVQRYRAWYGVRGVFLDEVTHDDAHLPYYRSLTAPLRAEGERVVLNPGLVPAPGYFDIADVVVTFEGAASGYADALRAMPGWVRALAHGRVAHLLYDADERQALHAADLGAAGWLYATSGTLPDPWSTQPAYLAALEARLARCA
jgi:hypothetical protein